MREELAEARQRRRVRQSSGALVLLRRHLWTTAGACQSHAPGQSGRGLPHSKTSRTSRGACELAPARTADFQSAVSRISNPLGSGVFSGVTGLSKALPTGSRRYSRLETCGTHCTADFQSAVSRISNPQGLGIVQSIRFVQGPADWKSATQQVGNLRHNFADFARGFRARARVGTSSAGQTQRCGGAKSPRKNSLLPTSD